MFNDEKLDKLQGDVTRLTTICEELLSVTKALVKLQAIANAVKDCPDGPAFGVGG